MQSPAKQTEAPFELKSDAPASGEVEIVTKAVEDFKSAVDDRLKELEKKAANDNAVTDRLNAIELRLNRHGAGAEPKPANDNGEIERKSFVSYLRSGVERMPASEAKSLTLSNQPSAGYLAPPQFASEMLKHLVLFSPIRAYASKVQISSFEAIYPRRTSIVAASWVGETDPRAASSTTFEQVTLKPYELATFVDISNQLLEDNAYNLEGEIALQFGESFGKVEGAAFVTGTGVGQPMGLLTSPQITKSVTTTDVVISNGQALMASPSTVKNIIALYHAIPSAWAQAAVWIMNRTTLGTLRGICDMNGRPLLVDPVTAGAASTILGRPIVEAPDMPDIAPGSTPILFGDLGGYRIVDRVGLSALRDPYSQAAVGLTRFYARKRVGGDVIDGDRFVKLAIQTK